MPKPGSCNSRQHLRTAVRDLLEQGKLQSEGPFQGSPGASKGQNEGALILLALVAIIQQQAGSHTRLETPQCYHGNLLVHACHLLD